MILLCVNAPSHTAKSVKDALKSLGDPSDFLSHPPNSSNLASSGYHLFSSMGRALAEQYFINYEEVGKWLLAGNGIHKLLERWAKCVEAEGQYLKK